MVGGVWRSEEGGGKGGGLRLEARGSRCGVPRRPWRAFALLSPTLLARFHPPAPCLASPSPAEVGLRVGGVRVCSPSAFAFGAGRNPVAAPPALAPWPRRVSGCAAWRRVPVASPRSGSRPSRGASEPRLTRGAPPSAASRHPPWMALRSVGGPSPRPVFLPCASLFAPTPQTLLTPFLPPSLQAPGPVRVRPSVSFPASSPNRHPHALARSCPASRRSPPSRRGGGAWAAGAGEGTVRVGRCHGEGVLGSEGGAGAGQPRRPWMGGRRRVVWGSWGGGSEGRRAAAVCGGGG